MSSNTSSTLREILPSRCGLLTTLGGVTALWTAGCSDVLLEGDSGSTNESSEVIVENRTSSAIEIAVRVIDSESETLFSHVFNIEPETMVSRGAIETTPSEIHAFTPDCVSYTWRYDPDLPVEFECEPKDIGLTLHDDTTIEPWYDC
ncbi:MAG: hypothetical protein ACOCQ3_00230 [Natronomonas sp.]